MFKSRRGFLRFPAAFTMVAATAGIGALGLQWYNIVIAVNVCVVCVVCVAVAVAVTAANMRFVSSVI